MMTDFWLRSYTKRHIFVDFSKISSFSQNAYISFDFISSMDSGAYYDIETKSSYLNLNGDLSLSSSMAISVSGDMSFKTGYITSEDTDVDFSLLASFKNNVFTSMALTLEIHITSVVDFDLESSVSKSYYRNQSIRSLVRYESYNDFHIGSTYKKLAKYDSLSFGMTSYFRRVGAVGASTLVSLDRLLCDQVFCINILSGNLADSLIPFANLNLKIDYNLAPVMVDAGNIFVITIVNLNTFYQHSGEIAFLKEVSLSGVYSIGTQFSYEPGALEDLNSAIIEMKFERDIVDFQDDLGDHISINLFAKKIDIRKTKSEIVIPFANILYLLRGSDYYGVISLPQKDAFVDSSVIITGFKQGFEVDMKVAKYYMSNIIGESITFETLTGDASVLIEDFKMTSIALPVGAFKTKNIDKESIFLSYIQLKYKIVGETPSIHYVIENFSPPTFIRAYGMVTAGALSTGRIVGLVDSFGDRMFILDTSACHINGLWASDDIVINNITVSGRYAGGNKVTLFPSTSQITDLSEAVFGEGTFIPDETIDLPLPLSTSISVSMDYFGYNTDLNGVEFLIKPILFYTNLIGNVDFIDNLVYTDRENIEGILSKESRFTANLMFTGEDLSSSYMEMTVTNYDN